MGHFGFYIGQFCFLNRSCWLRKRVFLIVEGVHDPYSFHSFHSRHSLGFLASRLVRWLLGFSACPVASRLLSFSACLVASRFLGFSASRLVSYFSASRLLVAFLGPFYPWIEKLRLTNKARTPCFCSLQRSGFYVRRFQLLPLKVFECCGAFCGRPPGATAQSSSYQENQQQEPRLGARCTKTELPISSPSPK